MSTEHLLLTTHTHRHTHKRLTAGSSCKASAWVFFVFIPFSSGYNWMFFSRLLCSSAAALPYDSARRPARSTLSIPRVWRPQSGSSTRIQHGLQSRVSSCHVSARTGSTSRAGVRGISWRNCPGSCWSSSCGSCRSSAGSGVPHTGKEAVDGE